MNYDYILGIDPSGNFKEGKGTTGLALVDAHTNQLVTHTIVSASDYTRMELYWDANLNLITTLANQLTHTGIVMEDYVLYNTRAKAQVNSTLETPKLIGLLQWWFYKNKIPYHMQLASAIKSRWTDELLAKKKIIIKHGNTFRQPGTLININHHSRDALRHAVHYATFYNIKEEA